MNRYEKAFNVISDVINRYVPEHGIFDGDLKVLSELVNTAIPKKIKWWKDYDDGHLMSLYIECPCCEYDFTDDEIDRQVNCCPECGQVLNWEVDDE